MNTSTTTLSPELEALARKRVNKRMGFLTHAFIYAVVITGLNLLAFSQGKVWSLWPTAGWGLGLLMHGLGMFGLGPGIALRARMLARERERLSSH